MKKKKISYQDWYFCYSSPYKKFVELAKSASILQKKENYFNDDAAGEKRKRNFNFKENILKIFYIDLYFKH